VLNLASKVMADGLKQVGPDGKTRYGYRPLLVESFVDRHRFTGKSYRAATGSSSETSPRSGRKGPKGFIRSNQKDIYFTRWMAKARAIAKPGGGVDQLVLCSKALSPVALGSRRDGWVGFGR